LKFARAFPSSPRAFSRHVIEGLALGRVLEAHAVDTLVLDRCGIHPPCWLITVADVRNARQGQYVIDGR